MPKAVDDVWVPGPGLCAAMPSSAPVDATTREKGTQITRENLEKTVSPPASCEPRLDERGEKKKEKKREARRRAAQKKARQVAAREARRQVCGALATIPAGYLALTGYVRNVPSVLRTLKNSSCGTYVRTRLPPIILRA